MITAAKRPKIGYTKYTHIFGQLAAKPSRLGFAVAKMSMESRVSGTGMRIFVAAWEHASATRRVVIIKCGENVFSCVFFMLKKGGDYRMIYKVMISR